MSNTGEKIVDVAIVGAGPAGYTAAIYTTRAMRETLIITGPQPGGQLMITTDVENYPGFADPVMGPDLMLAMRQQVENLGTKLLEESVKAVDFSCYPLRLTTDTQTISARSIVITTGAQAKWLGIPGEKELRGYGVSACATCDGFFFRGKEIAVIGGGNTAVEEALYLTNFASKVYLIHRRDTLRAEQILQNRLFDNKKIVPIWNHIANEILPTDDQKGVKAIKLQNTENNKEQTLSVDGVFVAIGHQPTTWFLQDNLALDEQGYVITNHFDVKTKIPGVFVAGDIVDKHYRQAITAAGMGCMAGLEANAFLSTKD